MARLACLCFLFVSAAAGAAHAQGLYLPNQTSGVGVAAAVDYNQDAFGLGLGGGYSYKAFIDGGAFVHRYGFSPNDPAVDVSAIAVQPYVNVHLLRQTDRIPVSLATHGAFQYRFYQTNADNRDLSGWGFFLGGSTYRRFDASDTTSVTPQLALGYQFLHTNGATGLFKTERNDGGFLVRVATALAFHSGDGPIWGLNPFMTVDTNYVTFGLTFGATFPMKSAPPPAPATGPARPGEGVN